MACLSGCFGKAVKRKPPPSVRGEEQKLVARCSLPIKAERPVGSTREMSVYTVHRASLMGSHFPHISPLADSSIVVNHAKGALGSLFLVPITDRRENWTRKDAQRLLLTFINMPSVSSEERSESTRGHLCPTIGILLAIHTFTRLLCLRLLREDQK